MFSREGEVREQPLAVGVQARGPALGYFAAYSATKRSRCSSACSRVAAYMISRSACFAFG